MIVNVPGPSLRPRRAHLDHSQPIDPVRQRWRPHVGCKYLHKIAFAAGRNRRTIETDLRPAQDRRRIPPGLARPARKQPPMREGVAMLIAASIGSRISSFAMIFLLVVAAVAGDGSLTSALRGDVARSRGAEGPADWVLRGIDPNPGPSRRRIGHAGASRLAPLRRRRDGDRPRVAELSPLDDEARPGHPMERRGVPDQSPRPPFAGNRAGEAARDLSDRRPRLVEHDGIWRG